MSSTQTNSSTVIVLTVDQLRDIVREQIDAALEEHTAAQQRPELLTVAQACAALQISRATLHRLRAEGLPTVTVGDSPRIRIADAIEWMQARERRT